MQINIYTDGGSLGNPGPAAIGFAIFNQDKLLFKAGEKIGFATNNMAEYRALIAALEKTKDLFLNKKPDGVFLIAAFSDSQLMINQLKGLYKIKNKKIKQFVDKIKSLEKNIGASFSYYYIPREKNSFVDSLVKKAFL